MSNQRQQRRGQCNILRRLARIKSDEDLKSVIRKCKCEDVNKIVEMVVRVMSKKLPVNKTNGKLLTENRHIFRHLVHPKYSWKSKKKYLLQKGGGVGSALAKAVGKMAGKVLRSPVVTRSVSAMKGAAGKVAIPMREMPGVMSSKASKAVEATTSFIKKATPPATANIRKVAGKIVKRAHNIQRANPEARARALKKPFKKYGKWRGRNPIKTAMMDTTTAGGTASERWHMYEALMLLLV